MSLKKGKFYYSLMSNRDKMRYKGNLQPQNVNFEKVMNTEFDSFESFLKQSFDWRISMQGNDYWEIVCKQMLSKKEMRVKDLFFIWFFFFLVIFIFSYLHLNK